MEKIADELHKQIVFNVTRLMFGDSEATRSDLQRLVRLALEQYHTRESIEQAICPNA